MRCYTKTLYCQGERLFKKFRGTAVKVVATPDRKNVGVDRRLDYAFFIFLIKKTDEYGLVTVHDF